jgi:peptide chain release factor 2
MNDADFWSNPQRAQQTIEKFKVLKSQTELLESAIREFEDAKVGIELAREAGDQAMLAEADEALFQLGSRMERVEHQTLLSGKHDHRNCFVSIRAGAGGAEAEDWASMLERMYLYYWQKMGWKVEEMSRSPGAELGLSEVSYHLKGEHVFGYMACERGTHRLARVSPFNAQGKRQTSFASVDVTPEFDEAKLEIPERDLEIVPFVRASGPGGQNVNKVATAIRLTHLPTGIQVVASTYRDQPQNRKQALAVLQAKLELIEEERRQKEIDVASGGRMTVDTIDWGTQIRSYVIYDNRVKDHRTGHEVMNPQVVLDGEIEGFVDAELKRKRGERKER